MDSSVALVQRLKDESCCVRKSACDALARLAPEALAPHAAALARLLNDDVLSVRKSACDALARLAPEALASHAASLGQLLSDASCTVRESACDAFARLAPEAVAPHAAALAQLLKDEDWLVRKSACVALARLAPEALAPHAAAFAQLLKDEDWLVRKLACVALARLAPEALAPHAAAIVQLLRDEDGTVRESACVALAHLASEALAPHAAALARLLRDEFWSVRKSACDALARLVPEALAPHAAALAQLMKFKSCSVRESACVTLARLTPEVLAPHAAAVVQLLKDESCSVRELACNALARLAPEALAQHVAALVHLLKDDVLSVRKSACDALGRLLPEALALHAAALAQLLKDEDWAVRKSACDALARLLPEALAPHAAALAQLLNLPDKNISNSASSALKRLSVSVLHGHVGSGNRSLHALHEVAQFGDLSLCKLFVEAGELVRLRDASGRSPQDIAKQYGHKELEEYFRNCCKLDRFVVGDGAAFEEAMEDDRNVVDVSWFTTSIRGLAAWIGVKHSILRVVVSGDDGSKVAYAMEKTKAPNPNCEVSRNGILVSHWLTVAAMMTESPLRHLCRRDIQCGLTVATLRSIGVQKGDYDLRANSCHHFAQDIFNACAATEALRIYSSELPNSTLTAIAKFFGLDVTASTSAPIRVQSSCVAIRGSEINTHLYDPAFFAISGNTQLDGLGHQRLARLSADIYNDHLTFPDFQLMTLLEIDDQNPVRCAVLQGNTCDSKVYMVFKGTDTLVDALVDLTSMPDKHECGLNIAGGMHLALKQHVFKNLPSGADVILCGHSLGGGYAILTALELLWRGVNVVSVVTFGAPQVVAPDPTINIFQQLSRITCLYVNAWDVVPRLPSCQKWVDAMPSWAGFAKGYFTFKAQHQVRDALKLGVTRYAKHYGIVGTLIFIKEGSVAMEQVSFEEHGGKQPDKLSDVPDGLQDTFLFQPALACHSISKYCDILAGSSR